MDRNKEFANRNPNEKVNFMTTCVLNIFQHFCPSKNIIVKGKYAPWMQNKIKNLLNQKTKLYKQYIKSGLQDDDKAKLDDITAHVSKLVSETKQNYLVNQSNKLNDPLTGTKTDWSILYTFLNKKKIPMIPPIVFNYGFVTDVGEKVNIFNNCFADQCTPIDNGSRLPPFEYKGNKRLSNVEINDNDMLRIITSLDPQQITWVG